MVGQTVTAFVGDRRIASGGLVEVALQAKQVYDGDRWAQVLIFDDESSETIEVDLRGTEEEVRRRLQSRLEFAEGAQSFGKRGRGRPKLGVVAREVTLLPRHWEWLNSQPGGASVTLRKLVEAARKADASQDQVRRRREVVYRFLSVMAGNLPDFEEVTRCLFRGDRAKFEQRIEAWPADIRDHVQRLAHDAFE